MAGWCACVSLIHLLKLILIPFQQKKPCNSNANTFILFFFLQLFYIYIYIIYIIYPCLNLDVSNGGKYLIFDKNPVLQKTVCSSLWLLISLHFLSPIEPSWRMFLSLKCTLKMAGSRPTYHTRNLLSFITYKYHVIAPFNTVREQNLSLLASLLPAPFHLILISLFNFVTEWSFSITGKHSW